MNWIVGVLTMNLDAAFTFRVSAPDHSQAKQRAHDMLNSLGVPKRWLVAKPITVAPQSPP
jgi:hypothetical protein